MTSILFQLGTWTVGGVERVTVVLANEFIRRGCRVAVSAYRFEDRMLLKELSSEIEVVELAGGFTDDNAVMLHDVLVRREVSAVINQWCVNFKHTQFLRRVMAGTGAKLIAVHHNRPDMNKRIMDARNPLVKFFWKRVTAWSLRKVYAASDGYVVLSPSFIDLFKSVTGVRNVGKLMAIPNPVTIAPPEPVAWARKENVLLYVGRLEETQKRVSRILAVWRALASDYPDWRLEIVGDGPDRARYEAAAVDLPRVHFAGVWPPADYYARAKILLLTSDFEGFPLVLCEAMAFGCVPVVLGSYAAAYDVLGADGRCGAVFDPPWHVVSFCGRVRTLLGTPDTLEACSRSAIARAASYGVSSVVDAYKNAMRMCHYTAFLTCRPDSRIP